MLKIQSFSVRVQTMPTILFYFDFVSPYAYLAFHRLPHVLRDMAWQVQYRPVVVAGLLEALNSTPPSSIPAKHAWIQRHVQWLAEQDGLPFRMPARHPFYPITWLRMALASSAHGLPGRQVCETLFNTIWQHGLDPDDPAVQQQAWQDATALLPASVRSMHDPLVKQELRDLGQSALAQGVFGVPAFVLLPEDDEKGASEVFWGVEGLPMLREAVRMRQIFGEAGEQ